jgi:flavin-dependent dehydrogenase
MNTTSLQDVSSGGGELWDAVVIGAGPAGAVTAYGLATSGYRILVVDRGAFPRAKVCGGCISLRSIRTLQSLGLAGVVDSLHGEPISGLRIRTGRGRKVRISLSGGLAVTRRTLDDALVRAAVDAGASFVCGAAARVVAGTPLRSDARAVKLRSTDGGEAQVLGRVVVAADGIGHPSLQGLGEFRSIQSPRSRIGLGTVLESTPTSYQRGTIHMAVGRSGYVGLVQAENGAFDIAAAVDPDFLRSGRTPAGAVAAILRETGLPIPEGIYDATWQGTAAMSQRLMRPVGRRVIVIGDAAGYVEPFTGEGIAWALTDAAVVPKIFERGLINWTNAIEDLWIGARKRLVVRNQRLCRITSHLLRSPVGLDVLLRLLARYPRLADSSVERLNIVPRFEQEKRM